MWLIPDCLDLLTTIFVAVSISTTASTRNDVSGWAIFCGSCGVARSTWEDRPLCRCVGVFVVFVCATRCWCLPQVALVAYWSAAVWLHLAHIREVADSDGVVNQTHLKRHLRKLHPNSPAAHIISQNVIAQYEKKGWLLVEAFLDCARESATWRVADAHDEGPVMRDEFGAFMTDLTGADIADADLDTLFAALDSGGRGTVDRGAVRRRLSALRASNIGVPNKRGRHEWQLLRESWTRADTVAQGLTA